MTTGQCNLTEGRIDAALCADFIISAKFGMTTWLSFEILLFEKILNF